MYLKFEILLSYNSFTFGKFQNIVHKKENITAIFPLIILFFLVKTLFKF